MLVGNKISREQKIRIGGICYSISFEDDISFFDECLGPFIIPGDTEAVSTCRLSIVKGVTKSAVQRQQGWDHRIFEADTTWGLYGISNFFLSVPSLKNGSRTQLFAEFDKDFKCGTVHMGRAGIHHFLYPFLEVLTINLLCRGKGTLLHASCIDDNGKGYLFVGQSGAGKSTMANLWNGKQGVKVLSDDRVIVSEWGEGFVAYGTPWHGTANYAMNANVLLEKIFLIRHAEKNTAEPVKGLKPVGGLIRDSFLPFWDRDGIEYSIGLIDRIAGHIDLFELGFLPGEEAVDFVRRV